MEHWVSQVFICYREGTEVEPLSPFPTCRHTVEVTSREMQRAGPGLVLYETNFYTTAGKRKKETEN